MGALSRYSWEVLIPCTTLPSHIEQFRKLSWLSDSQKRSKSTSCLMLCIVMAMNNHYSIFGYLTCECHILLAYNDTCHWSIPMGLFISALYWCGNISSFYPCQAQSDYYYVRCKPAGDYKLRCGTPLCLHNRYLWISKEILGRKLEPVPAPSNPALELTLLLSFLKLHCTGSLL